MHLSVSVPMHVCTIHFATMSDKQWHLGRSATCDNVLHRLQVTKTSSGSLHSLQGITCLFFHQPPPPHTQSWIMVIILNSLECLPGKAQPEHQTDLSGKTNISDAV